jgi:hypothetical protein
MAKLKIREIEIAFLIIGFVIDVFMLFLYKKRTRGSMPTALLLQGACQDVTH